MRVGVLVTGDTAVRAAHSLQADPSVDDVVVIGPATSKNFEVVDTAEGCNYLVGTGSSAPAVARQHRVPLLWDGDSAEDGCAVWGASPSGLTLAIADREADPQLVAVAHPDLPAGSGRTARFPDPVGRVDVADAVYGGRHLAVGRSPNQFAASLAIGAGRRVTIVDDGAFLAGIALGAAIAAVADSPAPVWERSLPYLQAATAMGLVMAEDV